MAQRRYERSSDSEKYHPPPRQQSIASSFCGRSHHYADYSTHRHTPKSDAVWFWRKPKNSDWGHRPWEPIEACRILYPLLPLGHFEPASGGSEVSGPRVEARTVSRITFALTTIRKSLSGPTQNAWITLFSRLSGSRINRIVYAQKPNRKRRLSMRLGQAMFRWSSIILFACAACSTTSSSAAGQDIAKKTTATPTRDAGLAAWQQIYSVLTHPRCINCHTATNYPQQGDDRHRHLFNIIRGPGGKGVAGLNCVTCHQGSNAESTGVPGAHNWQLAPLSMRWQDLDDKILSSVEVCRSLTDRSKNDNLGGAGLLKHHDQEPLVLWAFQPGHHRDGTARTLPPLTHEEFVAATRTWVEAGTPCPQNP